MHALRNSLKYQFSQLGDALGVRMCWFSTWQWIQIQHN